MHAPTPETTDLTEPLRSRWSPSIFDDRHELDDDQVELLLHAAQWAPSSGNSQPWSFLVLRRGSAGHQTLVSHLSRGNAGWVPRASVVILAATQIAVDPALEPPREGERPPKPVNPAYSYYDLGQSAAHLTLQAHAMDLFAHQFAGFDREATAKDLGVPDHFAIPAGIALGRRGDPQDVDERDRDREQRPRERRRLTDVAHLDRWDGAWGRPPA